jgi:hypothetical protein
LSIAAMMWMVTGSASVGRGGTCTDMTVNTLYLHAKEREDVAASGLAERSLMPSARARGKQELLLAVHVAATHQVDVLASLHWVALAVGVEVDNPMHGRFPSVKLAVPASSGHAGEDCVRVTAAINTDVLTTQRGTWGDRAGTRRNKPSFR